MKRSITHFVERFVGGNPIVKCGTKGISVDRVTAERSATSCNRCRKLLRMLPATRVRMKKGAKLTGATGTLVVDDVFIQPARKTLRKVIQSMTITAEEIAAEEAAVDEFAAEIKARLTRLRASIDPVRHSPFSVRMKLFDLVVNAHDAVDVGLYAMILHELHKRGTKL